jgi:hypothetical protein
MSAAHRRRVVTINLASGGSTFRARASQPSLITNRRPRAGNNAEDETMETLILANMAGYLIVGAGGLVVGTLVGSKVTGAVMSMVHGLETRVTAVEAAATATKAAATTTGTGKHAAAIEAHATAVTKLAGAIEKHAAAVDEHGAATVAAAVETSAATAATATAATTATTATK